jgi:IS5 family transposase
MIPFVSAGHKTCTSSFSAARSIFSRASRAIRPTSCDFGRRWATGVEELLATTIAAAVQMKAVRPTEFERVIVDTTVQQKAIAYPTDSRLLEIARGKLARLAQRAGLTLKQTYEREGKQLRRRAGGYSHAKQFKRLHRVLKRQRTILGRLLRDIERKLSNASTEQQASLSIWLEHAWRICRQRAKDKHKLYALHAPEAECISKGKARQPYEFTSLHISRDSGAPRKVVYGQ